MIFFIQTCNLWQLATYFRQRIITGLMFNHLKGARSFSEFVRFGRFNFDYYFVKWGTCFFYKKLVYKKLVLRWPKFLETLVLRLRSIRNFSNLKA